MGPLVSVRCSLFWVNLVMQHILSLLQCLPSVTLSCGSIKSCGSCNDLSLTPDGAVAAFLDVWILMLLHSCMKNSLQLVVQSWGLSWAGGRVSCRWPGCLGAMGVDIHLSQVCVLWLVISRVGSYGRIADYCIDMDKQLSSLKMRLVAWNIFIWNSQGL